MKKILFSIAAMAMLVGCGSKDDDTPNGGDGKGGNGTTTPTTQSDYLPTKKVKTITCKSIIVEIDYTGGAPAPSLGSSLEPTLNGQKFVAKTLNFAYEYDEKGRIKKITRKEEGKSDNVKTFIYGDSSVKITFPNEDTGGIENREVGLNAAGNMLGLGTYDSNQRLTKGSRGDFEWTNDNLTKISEKRNWRGKVTTVANQLSYNNNLNKNKFLLYNFEGDAVTSYAQYFDFQIGWIQGVAPKNLLQKMVLTEDGTVLNYTYNYTYTFDTDGFVKTINETRNARAGSDTGLGYFTDADYLTKLTTLITNIQNGTEKNKKYQLVSDKSDEKVFDIIIPIKVEKDKNGKTINLTVNKVARHTFKLKTENGAQVVDNIRVEISYNSDMTTTYQLNY
ncbi:DUF4595 domain-containing protein [Capnocytophaga periodontitidis]|uniref:DUF4595 domain-containing protein n=1 Tax=Capnocytophaga periodontitidis TaxID=2795027 RepID=UPI0018E195DB|nr:DUF4595 domain-containing protein [Capnocytophaga periodontitidis]MBI1669070.1 DUF4595 domain-containing protein [Capnocytophaga periodontitidis]